LPLTAMLNLVRAFTGAPASTLHCLSLPTESLLVSIVFSVEFVLTRTILFSQLYPSADTVVILDAVSLRLVRTLAFSQVFPGRDHASTRITSLAVDSALKLVRTSSPITTFPHIPGRWSQHPARGLLFGPSLEFLLALGSFTHHSFFLMTSTSQLLTVAPVRFPYCRVFFAIAHPVQVSWPSRHNQRCPFTH
jgi:hypothetical protein